MFSRETGTPVPVVDPKDLKAIWQFGKDVCARHPEGTQVAVGTDLTKRACNLGADFESVLYRAGLLKMWLVVAQAYLTCTPEQKAAFPPMDEELVRRTSQPDDTVFRAISQVPAEWLGVGIVHNGPPFDVKEFLRLCDEL
jgi:hypothetical protein